MRKQYIYTTNPLERVSKEIKRRSKVIEVFKERKALEKMVFLVILEMNESYNRRKLKYWDRIIEALMKKREKNTPNYKRLEILHKINLHYGRKVVILLRKG